MLNILQERYFAEHYSNGFVETNISLPETLVDEIRQYYEEKPRGRNDFLNFFATNEHQAYIEGRKLGMYFRFFPKNSKKWLKKVYDRAYDKAVCCEQTYIEKVLLHLLANDFQRLFKTRYIVASYDMYLRNSHRCPAAGIHTDMPNFHHFYETENDLSLYIPLVDLDHDNGGKITVLPENKLKVPGNVLLKLLYDHFSGNPEYLDENGYIDPNKISPAAITAFVRSDPHQNLMNLYKNVVGLAKKQHAGDFRQTTETKGTVLLFNNKNFHAAEPWKNEVLDREVYIIRMFPIYDAKIKLKREICGTPVNNFLMDMEQGEVHRFEQAVDVTRIPDEEKVKL